jgi:hypothetical protein
MIGTQINPTSWRRLEIIEAVCDVRVERVLAASEAGYGKIGHTPG